MCERANHSLIGITQRLARQESYKELREILAVEWGELFEREFKGFLPLPLCFGLDFSHYESALSAVILSGGNDLSTFNNTQENKIRDEYERQILVRCVDLKLPVLAICRGAQLMAHFFDSKLEKRENHIGSHLVRDKQDNKFSVNSFHNYAILKLGKDLECLAKAQDETIEAFKHKNLPFYALMWHIERENGLNNVAVLEAFKSEILKFKGARK